MLDAQLNWIGNRKQNKRQIERKIHIWEIEVVNKMPNGYRVQIQTTEETESEGHRQRAREREREKVNNSN